MCNTPFGLLVTITICAANVAAFAPSSTSTSNQQHSQQHHRCFVMPALLKCSLSEDDETISTRDGDTMRRALLASIPLAVTSCSLSLVTSLPAQAAAAKISPDAAFTNLVRAREELITAAKQFIPKRDYEGMKDFLENATNINNFESNAQTLLESKRLDVESKKEIGTIRRYGVGADVIIMYGGLRFELDQEYPNSQEVSKYMARTLDSIEEVITICRGNGFS